MYRFKTQRKVEFADTDMGGIMHFARYLVFMETAEHQFLEAVGTSVTLELDGKRIGWPRVTASCEYRSPARFGDLLDSRAGWEDRDRHVAHEGRIWWRTPVSWYCCHCRSCSQTLNDVKTLLD